MLNNMLLPAVDRTFDDVSCINIYIDRHLRRRRPSWNVYFWCWSVGTICWKKLYLL